MYSTLASFRIAHGILRYKGAQDNLIFLGAALDGAARVPSMNDNGSGVVALLEIALQLAKYELTNGVRFGWWSASDLGQVGSYYYVDSLTPEELARIALYIK